MFFNENRKILNERFPEALRSLEVGNAAFPPSFQVVAEESRSGLPTLAVERNQTAVYIHSKYDPVTEAVRLVDNYPDLQKYRHIFFYGAGLGYHLEEVLKRRPDVEFSIYEPCPPIFREYLIQRRLNNLPLKSLKFLHVENSVRDCRLFLARFANYIAGDVLFFPLPSYERIFQKSCQTFLAEFQRSVFQKRYSLNASTHYEQKWTLNCLRNLEQVLQTPSFLRAAKDDFQGKPAIIAAAGPSLTDDLDRLRLIKERGLAYIFAAGSGMHPLLNAGIIPDAIVAYDPNDYPGVFQPVIDGKITSLPLIFGSSIGYSKLNEYPGPKLHFLSRHDTLASYYLRTATKEPLEFIADQPTISGIILQLLLKLGCNPIIFTGQNLAYRGNLTYAPGISYYDPNITALKLKGAYPVDDVYGGKVYSNDGFKFMRDALEAVIASRPDREIFNATKGGAVIKGAPFQPLEEITALLLKERVVSSEWVRHSTQTDYDWDYLQKRRAEMVEAYRLLPGIITQLAEVLLPAVVKLSRSRNARLDVALTKLTGGLRQLGQNVFFQVMIAPMKQVELEMIAKINLEIKSEPETAVKVERINQVYRKLITGCQADLKILTPCFELHLKSIKPFCSNNESTAFYGEVQHV